MNAERTEYEPFSFTLEMLIDYLRENGFAVLRRPDKPVLFADALFAESIHVGDMGDILSCTQKKALVVCEDCAGKSLEKARGAFDGRPGCGLRCTERGSPMGKGGPWRTVVHRVGFSGKGWKA